MILHVLLNYVSKTFISGDKKIEEGSNPKVSKTTTDEKKTGKDDTDIIMVGFSNNTSWST